jgi:hypothetical protein
MRKGIPAIIAKNLKKEYLTGQKIIKTVLEKEYVDRLFEKMGTKFNNNNGVLNNATLDFMTGKVKDMRESVIVVGIPYAMRIEENIKPFLNFIWTLEKGNISKMNKKDETRLIDDTNLPLDQQGEIYRILTKQTETAPEVVMDAGSHSLQNHVRALNEMINESQENG